MEDVEEAAERRIAGVAQPLARVLGEVQRQRPVRAEQAEEPHLQPRRRRPSRGSNDGQRRRRERQDRVLAEAHRLVDRPQRLAPARLVGVQALEPAQRLVEVVAGTARRASGRAEAAQSVGLAPHCAPPSLDLAAALRPQHGLGERVDRHVAREDSGRAPRRAGTRCRPRTPVSSTVTVISRPRPKASGPGAGSRRTTRLDAHRSDAFDLPPRR